MGLIISTLEKLKIDVAYKVPGVLDISVTDDYSF